MQVEIDIDEAREVRKALKAHQLCGDDFAPEFLADLDSAISNYDEAAHDRQTEAYYGGDGASQKQAAAFAAARKDAGR